VPGVTEAMDHAEDFIASSLASLGIEADEVERAVIAATHQVFWPGICELLAYDTREVEVEREFDLSKEPGEG
jgi:hypothetical protein